MDVAVLLVLQHLALDDVLDDLLREVELKLPRTSADLFSPPPASFAQTPRQLPLAPSSFSSRRSRRPMPVDQISIHPLPSTR